MFCDFIIIIIIVILQINNFILNIAINKFNYYFIYNLIF